MNNTGLYQACLYDLHEIEPIIRERQGALEQSALLTLSCVEEYVQKLLRIYKERINRNELFLYRENGKMLGFLVISKERDEVWENDIPNALYISDMFAITSYPHACLKLMNAVGNFLRRKGEHILRMDYDVNNPRLGALYKHRDYKECGIRTKSNGLQVMRMQKELR